MKEKNDQIFQLSLTELAFMIAFILLLLLGYMVKKEEAEKRAAEIELTKVQTIEHAITTLNAIQSTLATTLTNAGTQNPDALISKLIEADDVRVDRDRLKQQVRDLDVKLTSLTEIQHQIEKFEKSSRPEFTKHLIESSLTLQNEWRKQFNKQFDKDITPGQEVPTLQEVLSAAKSFNDLTKDNLNPAIFKLENSDLRGQVAFMKKKLDARGGRDFPPCWVDENGNLEFLFSIEVMPDSVLVTPAWPEKRESTAYSLPETTKILSSPLSNQSFINNIQGISNWSKNQNPECRHYVKLKSSISDAIQSDRARLMVERYFYKEEVRR